MPLFFKTSHLKNLDAQSRLESYTSKSFLIFIFINSYIHMLQHETVDAYIATFPKETQVLLEQMRATIKKNAPDAEEVISYGMPAFKWNGMLVYFAAYDKHIGFYPTGSGIAHFKDRFAGYKSSKGTVQFPLKKPLPLDLIAEIVAFRVTENLQKSELKKALKKK